MGESVVRLQERLDPLPQFGIAHAFPVQDFGAMREVMMICSFQENGLHALGVKRHGNGAPVEYNQSVPLSHAPFADVAVEKNQKKADVVEHPEVFDHVGLLANEPPGLAGLLFI